MGAQEAPAFLDLAGALLSEREPASLVAALLSLIEDEAHGGFDIPDAPKTEPRREKRTYAPRPGEKPGWTPEARRERPSRPHGKTAGTFEDRPRGPKRPGFRQGEDRFKQERKTGGKFFKKKG